MPPTEAARRSAEEFPHPVSAARPRVEGRRAARSPAGQGIAVRVACLRRKAPSHGRRHQAERPDLGNLLTAAGPKSSLQLLARIRKTCACRTSPLDRRMVGFAETIGIARVSTDLPGFTGWRLAANSAMVPERHCFPPRAAAPCDAAKMRSGVTSAGRNARATPRVPDVLQPANFFHACLNATGDTGDPTVFFSQYKHRVASPEPTRIFSNQAIMTNQSPSIHLRQCWTLSQP